MAFALQKTGISLFHAHCPNLSLHRTAAQPVNSWRWASQWNIRPHFTDRVPLLAFVDAFHVSIS